MKEYIGIKKIQGVGKMTPYYLMYACYYLDLTVNCNVNTYTSAWQVEIFKNKNCTYNKVQFLYKHIYKGVSYEYDGLHCWSRRK